MDTPSRALQLPSGTVVIPHWESESLTFRWQSSGGTHVVRSEILFVWCSEPQHDDQLRTALYDFNEAVHREEAAA